MTGGEFSFKIDACMTVVGQSKRDAENKVKEILAKANCFSSYLIYHDPVRR